MSQEPIVIFWLRRDLRLEDNVGLYHALQTKQAVLPLFIFDTQILDKLPKDDARVSFIHKQLAVLKKQLEDQGSTVLVHYGSPLVIFKNIIKKYPVATVYTNRDYEPYALERDETIKQLLATQNISFKTFKDQVIFETNQIVKGDGNPYVVYTPYKNKWIATLQEETHLKEYSITKNASCFLQTDVVTMPSLQDMGFEEATIAVPKSHTTATLIANYEATRNFPGIVQGTSRLGPHLRFGTVSIRQLVKKAQQAENKTFLSELIWREFFMQILWHFPHTTHKAFRPKYDRIVWRNNEAEFKKWCAGHTGYALVDAGMRELNTTGFMHNRVRMLVASFLCKHLLIDWRWGETYFAERLLDYDLSANVGNWQWAAGSGVDAAPYFRIFNPITQVMKFDKQQEYINKWVPELQELTYPPMMVDHKMARERCLKTYKEALR